MSLTATVSASTVRFDTAPSLLVGGREPVNVFAEAAARDPACVFEAGATYRDVTLRLEVTDESALLTCARAPTGE